MTRTTTAEDLGEAKYTLLGHIFGAHCERIGFTRTILGAIPQYTIVPMLIVIQVTLTLALYQWLLVPLLSTRKVRWGDYVVIDRYRISELTWFDKLNCMFCGWANGLMTMLNVELDLAADKSQRIPAWKWPVLALICIAYLPIYILFEINWFVIYDVLVATPLGYHRVTPAQAGKVMRDANWGAGHDPMFGTWLRMFKNLALRAAMDLDQIESSWCPLVHFETRKGVVYPKHHERFFGPHALEKMRDVLRTVGTVSDRLPKY